MSGTFRENLAVLRAGPFRRYAIGEAISMTGTWMQLMAQGWIMASLTSSAFVLGLVNFASGLPTMLLTMHGGAMADRLDKRLILQAAQVLQIIFALTMAWLVASGGIQIWHVVAVSVMLGIVAAFEMPAATALVPELVDKDEIGAAIAIDRALFHATRLVGPAVAGMAVGAWGAAAAYVANAASFVALMIALATLPPRPAGTPEEEEARQGGVADGFRFVLGDRGLLANVALIAASTLVVFPAMIVMMPIYATRTLGLDAAGMGTLMALSGLGSVAGALGLLSVPRESRGAVKIAAVAATGMALIGMAMAQTLGQASAAMVALTVGLSTLVGLANIAVQERAPGPMRGRVSAVTGLAFVGLMPIGGLLVPGAADYFGMRPALAGCSVVFATLAVGVLALEAYCGPAPDAQGDEAIGASSASEAGGPVGGSSPSGSSSTEAPAP